MSEDGQTLADNVQYGDLSEFERLCFERWDHIAKYARYSAEKKVCFRRLLPMGYYRILSEVAERRPKAFMPKYDIDVGNAPVEVQLHRGQLVTAMTVENLKFQSDSYGRSGKHTRSCHLSCSII